MLKAGVFLDIENLVRCGGWGMRYQAVVDLVERQGATVLRANAYMAIDKEREEENFEYHRRKEEYRSAARQAGFHVVLKAVQRYYDHEDDTWITKANVDLDLAVDALLQSENLDYILIGSGDGDFIRLVRALQNRGRRVDLLSFNNTNRALQLEVDRHFSGFLVPGLISMKAGWYRGTLTKVNEEKGFGFINTRAGGDGIQELSSVFCHITDVRNAHGELISNSAFAHMKDRQTVLEFELGEQPDGRIKAVNVSAYRPV